MNKKDHKAIAEIIKEHMNCFMSYKDYCAYCNKFADYFEKEDIKMAKTKCKIEQYDVQLYFQFVQFNVQQFLKDCGVEE